MSREEAVTTIEKVMGVRAEDIREISVLKQGMTNRSFLFQCRDKKYILRIPGEGTNQLINRKEEADVYRALEGIAIADHIVYINADNGYKITEYFENARTCNVSDMEDVKKCMQKLKKLHGMKLSVDHEFKVFSLIEYYESLREGASVYSDYMDTKKNVWELKNYIDQYAVEKVLCHIDAVADNFLFYKKNGVEELRLIDWEYAGMQDPHIDIAMFCVYSDMDKGQIDQVIDIYFKCKCTKEIRIKIYCYISVCGLLWSNWCEYKSHLGIHFGEYSLRQYRYAREYYQIAKRAMHEGEVSYEE